MEVQDALHTESQRTGRRRPAVRRSTRPTTGEPAPQNWSNSGPARGRRRTDPRRSAASSRRPRKAHFLRMAFIGASSGAAAFFFLMARRFMPFMALAFLPPLRIAFLIALRIAFAMTTEGGGTRVAVCRALLFAGLD